MKKKMPEINDNVNDIASAKRVLETEIAGLKALEDWVGDKFVSAVDIISKLKGRVILSGMGKSGHIAKKIAATMSSTGTPALFVHPAEASHGDLGMITNDDAVILLSNSGETAELKDIISYCGRFKIPLIAMVRRKTSVLVTAADVALVLPEVPEACNVNAPTTSTTMMLALGDALAVALLERRGFTGEDFNVFHPGGKLGSALLRVKDLMHSGDSLPLISSGSLMSDALIVMTNKRLGCVAIVKGDDELIGVITDGDLRRHMSPDLTSKTVDEIMTKNPLLVNDTDLATKALNLMESKSITSLFVVDNKKLKGVLHIHDILRAGVV
jgi:arabinose-5-phosphate isomerase